MHTNADTPIGRFAADLTSKLRLAPLPSTVRTERDLERRFLVPIAIELAARHRDVWICTHPFKGRQRCKPDCDTAHRDRLGVVHGCPRCWSESKPWASVAAFGTHHTFDLAARNDSRSETLVLEGKCVAARGGRMPNGEIQRMLGQCALATARHRQVIGLLVHRGPLREKKWDEHTDLVRGTFERSGVTLIVRGLDRPAGRVAKASQGVRR